LLGQTAAKYCGAKAELTLKSLEITIKCLKDAPQCQPGVKAIFKCLHHAMAGDKNSISSQEGIDEPNIELMNTTKAKIERVIEKHERKRKNEPDIDCAPTTTSGALSKHTMFCTSNSSVSIRATQEAKKKLKKQKSSGTSSEEHQEIGESFSSPDASDGLKKMRS
jgi:hypothetical protein